MLPTNELACDVNITPSLVFRRKGLCEAKHDVGVEIFVSKIPFSGQNGLVGTGGKMDSILRLKQIPL